MLLLRLSGMDGDEALGLQQRHQGAAGVGNSDVELGIAADRGSYQKK
jgi:hypothetical protein